MNTFDPWRISVKKLCKRVFFFVIVIVFYGQLSVCNIFHYLHQWSSIEWYSSGSRGAGAQAHALLSNLRSQIVVWVPNYTFLHSKQKFPKNCLLLLSVLFKFSVDIFWPKTLKNFQALLCSALSYIYTSSYVYSLNTYTFLQWWNYCKSIKKFLLSDFHCEAHFSVHSMHTGYDPG